MAPGRLALVVDHRPGRTDRPPGLPAHRAWQHARADPMPSLIEDLLAG